MKSGSDDVYKENNVKKYNTGDIELEISKNLTCFF